MLSYALAICIYALAVLIQMKYENNHIVHSLLHHKMSHSRIMSVPLGRVPQHTCMALLCLLCGLKPTPPIINASLFRIDQGRIRVV